MKVCKFCNTVCDDSVQKCPSCGGLEFNYKCANCGTVYNTSHCPNCGVKFDEQARICPKCNTKYFSASCPTCGYNVNNATPNHQTINYYHTVSNSAPVYKVVPKKKHTAWTILLWLCFWPIMIFVTIWKSKRIDLKWKIIITAVILAFSLVFGILGQTSDASEPNENSQLSVSTSSASASIWTSQITPLDQFDYYIDGTELFIKDYNGIDKKVRIADSYEVDGVSLKVVSLDGTFALENVKSVILPNTLRNVSSNCFNSSGIEFLYIPSSLKEVPNTFWGYFHDLEKIYYQGTEEQWKKLCTVERSRVDVKQVIFNTDSSNLK